MTSRRLPTVAVTLLLALVVALAAPVAAPSALPGQTASAAGGSVGGVGPASAGVDPDTVLVRFRRGVSADRARARLAGRGATIVDGASAAGYVAVRAPGRAATLRHQLVADQLVAAVQPNFRRHALVTPNDPRYKRQRKYLSLIRLPEAWDIGRGSPYVDIAVVDTGVDLDTPDLAGRIAPGYNTFSAGRTRPEDDHGHGTMVAGIAAAITGNDLGVAGAAWTARVIPVKALDAHGWGDDAHVIAGIRWAADHGAEIINLSLGDAAPSPALHAAVQYARQRGALIVAAAGNTGVDMPIYPAAYPEVLAVSAIDDDGEVAEFSTRGSWVDIAAPGQRIMSTAMSADEPDDEKYDRASGTSFAAPLVSGVAALVRARYPTRSADQVAVQLRSTAHDAGPAGVDADFGAGILDAAAALGADGEASGR